MQLQSQCPLYGKDGNRPTLLHIRRYATGHFGKWHLGGGRDVKNAPGFDQYGFDEHAGTYESPDPDPLITATNWIWSDKDSVKRWDRTKYFVDKTLDFLSRRQDKPCFVNLWPDDVHTPWVPRKDPECRDKSPNLAVRSGEWKLLMNSDGTDIQLFNIENDSNETSNLVDSEPAVVANLKDKLLRWWESLPKLTQSGS